MISNARDLQEVPSFNVPSKLSKLLGKQIFVTFLVLLLQRFISLALASPRRWHTVSAEPGLQSFVADLLQAHLSVELARAL